MVTSNLLDYAKHQGFNNKNIWYKILIYVICWANIALKQMKVSGCPFYNAEFYTPSP